MQRSRFSSINFKEFMYLKFAIIFYKSRLTAILPKRSYHFNTNKLINHSCSCAIFKNHLKTLITIARFFLHYSATLKKYLLPLLLKFLLTLKLAFNFML